jgi:hypothetical protein
MAAPIKMDELLVSWLGSDEVYENVLQLIEKYRVQRKQQQQKAEAMTPPGSPKRTDDKIESPRAVVIPPFYPLTTATGTTIQRRRQLPRQSETWEPLPDSKPEEEPEPEQAACVRDQVVSMLQELEITPVNNTISFPLDSFVRITKEVCHFPSFFNGPLYQRILDLWNASQTNNSNSNSNTDTITLTILEWFWKSEMEPYDPPERFFRLVKQPNQDAILRDDFLPYIKALLNDHPVSSVRFARCPFPSIVVLTRFYVVSIRASNSCPIMPNFKKSMPSRSSPVSFIPSTSVIRVALRLVKSYVPIY